MSRLATGIALGVLASPLGAQVTERVSLGAGGVQGNADAIFNVPPQRFVSADGRFVVWTSYANNFVPGDTNSAWDIFVRDRLTLTTEIASVDSQGNQGNGNSGTYGWAISADGRFVAFESASNNLVPGDTNGAREVFVRDRLAGTTERIALDPNGVQANGPSLYPSLSADGRYVAFTSSASNLVPGDTNAKWDVFMRDRQLGTTMRVSVGPGGVQGNADSYSYESGISADGSVVVFQSAASNLVVGDTNGIDDIFIYDLTNSITERVSVPTGGGQANGGSAFAQVSSDGQVVAFLSTASNLVPGDVNGQWDTFVHDRQSGVTELVSIATNGTQSNGIAGYSSMSDNGQFVLFASGGSNLVPNDTNGLGDVFLRDRGTGTTSLVSVAPSGSSALGSSGVGSISADGRFAVFVSDAADLISGDSNGFVDIFIRDLRAAGFTSICDPGNGTVINCPCGNPPATTGRGCDNSSATGGAVISASGAAYLSSESLAFTTAGERPTATSMLIQGDAEISSGIVFGQGVRCLGGAIKRLYLKTAVAGCITAPDFNAGDSSISTRSAALGAPIQPGQPYYYLVYYRDPFVLGGCPATSGFNATQTGMITWWP